MGSQFTIQLPLSEPTQEEPTMLDDSPNPVTQRRVLVVDDNKDAAKMLGMVVRMLGNEVRTAGDGQEALEVAAEFLPELVIMDIGMPVMNGYEAAKIFRQKPWGQSMVIVALTGWGKDEDRNRTREAGFDYHLVKPIEPAALQKLLDSHRTISRPAEVPSPVPPGIATAL